MTHPSLQPYRNYRRISSAAGQKPHWVAADLTGTRIVLNSDENGPYHRLFIVTHLGTKAAR
jgi:hypothetical protein